jgi:5-methylcytosine-specific restriction protein A
MVRKAWTQDELILALDLYHDLPVGDVNASHPRVIELSELLNRLSGKESEDDEKYRNPNGVAMKLHNFGPYDDSRSGKGLSHGGKLDEIIFNRYKGHRAQLAEDSAAIRAKVRS